MVTLVLPTDDDTERHHPNLVTEPHLSSGGTVPISSEGLIKRVSRIEDQLETLTDKKIIAILEQSLTALANRVSLVEAAINGT